MANNDDRDRDQSLLDRLNVLKGTTLNLDLDTSKNSLGIPISSFTPAKEARDDALSARLRSLRDVAQDAQPSPGSSGSRAAAGVAPTPGAVGSDRAPTPAAVAQPPSQPSTPHRTGVPAAKQHASTPPPRLGGPFSTFSPPAGTALRASGDAEDDPLFASDDKDLDELLEGLEDLGLDEADEPKEGQGVEDRQGASGPSLDRQLQEARRTAALFAKFEKHVSKGLDRAKLGSADGLGDDADKTDDDSDGEEMRREADDALLLALDELSLETARLPAAEAGPSEGPKGSGDPKMPSTKEKSTGVGKSAVPGADDDGDDDFSLPTPPSALPPVSPEDGPVKGPRRGSADFEAEFSSRLAALRAERPTAPAATDELGLPSVPSYKPGDTDKTPRLTTKTGYTDDDMKNWCILCLEDATCRCEGCDDDVYCEKCWWGMHVGPSADYDARGHRRWKFNTR